MGRKCEKPNVFGVSGKKLEGAKRHVLIANEKQKITRLWSPSQNAWKTVLFPTKLTEPGVRFGVLDPDGLPTVMVRNGETSGAWRFDGERWAERKDFYAGLEVDGHPVLTASHRQRVAPYRSPLTRDQCSAFVVSNLKQVRDLPAALHGLDEGVAGL